MLHLYNISVCINTHIKRTLDLWLSSFSFSFLKCAQVQIYLMVTSEYCSGWVAQYCVAIVATSFWSGWSIHWDSIFWVVKPEWVHQPTVEPFLSTLDLCSSWAGCGSHWKFRTDYSLMQISGPCDSFGASSSRTSTNTSLEAPCKAWLCFCADQK